MPTTFARAAGTLEMEVEDHVIVVDRQGEQMVTLSSVGGLIWDDLTRARSLDELVATCDHAFPGVGTEVLSEDVAAFLASAVDVGVVVEVEAG